MKTNCWLVLGTMLATSAVAQVNTNTLPAIPAPATVTTTSTTPVVVGVQSADVSAKKKATPVVHKKKAVTKAPAKPAAKKIAESPVTLVPGPATVAVENLNLRGQAGLKGEVVGRVKKGDAVTVISQINLDKSKTGEPAQWAKIALPSGTKVWVNNKFVDATNKVVTAKKLNLRGGPGENFSVLGVLEKGASVTEITSKGDWTQIAAPGTAFAFVAAGYLKQDTTVTPVAPVTPVVPVAPVPPVVEQIPATTSTVAEATPIMPVPTTAPSTVEMSAPAPALNNVVPPVTPTMPVAPVVPEIEDTNPPPPRVVTHEGYVRSSVSPVAPTYYELYDPVTGNAINYLYTTTTNLNLARYKNLQIVVTGEEGLDVRWQATPVLTIQKIYVLSTNSPSAKKR
jgi:uncharacterized protein YgiM (DUF1202 family)